MKDGDAMEGSCAGPVSDDGEGTAIFVRIEGRVQGVAFRYFCLNEARRLGLTGWVRNTPEGEVEVWAEGPGPKLDTLLQWLHRGPPGALVSAVHCEKRPGLGEYQGFNVEF
ncbi:acylphosphatase [Spirochaetia bacterium]|nr:acylphosphatase [Spirochaetia bacterium]